MKLSSSSAAAAGWLAATIAGLGSRAECQGDPTTFDWNDVHHQPASVEAVGTETTSYVNSGGQHHITFTHDGDERIRYFIDLNWTEVQEGMIRIRELETGAEPMFQAGLRWRHSGGTFLPNALAPLATTTMSVNFNSSTKKLTLIYDEVTGTVTTQKKYRFWLEGKALKIRAWATTTGSQARAWTDNYSGFYPGVATAVSGASEQHIPGMDSVPVVRFDDDDSETAYYSVLIDWYESSATGVTVDPESWNGSHYEFGWRTDVEQDTNGNLLTAVDERMSLTVTHAISDVFPLIPYAPSDFYDDIAGDMHLLGVGAAKTRNAYGSFNLHARKLREWGMTDVSGSFHAWSKYGLNIMPPMGYGSASVLGCNPDDIVYSGPKVLSLDGTYQVQGIDADANEALVQTEFGSLMTLLTNIDANDWSWALYQNSGKIDPQRVGYVPPPSYFAYPTHIPLSYPASKNGAERIGVIVPDTNSGYSTYQGDLVVSETGAPARGWNTQGNLDKSSWDTGPNTEPHGHPLERIAFNHSREFWSDTFTSVRAKYGPTALYIDASGNLPAREAIDRDPGSSRPHSIGEGLVELARALWEYKWDPEINGDKPLFGEPTHRRRTQFESFLSGIWDGVRRYIPSDLNTSNGIMAMDARIIPDYELRYVKPRASGHAGMGLEEGNFWPTTLDTPYDDDDDFVNGWFTNIVTFNHSAYATTSGHRTGPRWSMEGYVRNYYLLTQLQRRFRVAGTDNVVEIKYIDALGVGLDLDEAMAADYDFVDAKLHITYSNGLEIWANHDVSNQTTLAVTVPGNTQITIPADGFVAFDQSGLLVFSAYNPDPSAPTSTSRIDYASIPNAYEMITCRGAAQTFRGFPSQSLLDEFPDNTRDAFAAATVVRSHLVLGANGGGILIGADRGVWDYDPDHPNEGHWVPGDGAGVDRIDLDVQSSPR